MSELWLPASKLLSLPISEIQPGRLLILPPVGTGEGPARIGIKLKAGSADLAFALTPFYDAEGATMGDAIDLSDERGGALTLEATLSVEVDPTAGAIRGSRRDFCAGELVDTDVGLGIGIFFNRHNSMQRKFTCAVSVTTWEPLEANGSRTIFGDWRLRIDIDDYRPVYWKQDRTAAAATDA